MGLASDVSMTSDIMRKIADSVVLDPKKMTCGQLEKLLNRIYPEIVLSQCSLAPFDVDEQRNFAAIYNFIADGKKMRIKVWYSRTTGSLMAGF